MDHDHSELQLPTWFVPKPRPPLGTYIQRIRHDALSKKILVKSYSQPVMSVSPVPRPRKPLRSEMTKENHSNSQRYMQDDTVTAAEDQISKQRQRFGNSHEDETSFSDDSINHDIQMTENSDEKSFYSLHQSFSESAYVHNRSRTLSPERKYAFREKEESESTKQSQLSKENTQQRKTKKENTYKNIGTFTYLISVIVIALIIFFSIKTESTKLKQPTNSERPILFKLIEDVKSRFPNQEPDIWNDISSGINEVVTRTPKTPSIILLIGNETITMDCLASALAQASSTILGTDSPLSLNPRDFGDDFGEIIDKMNKIIPLKKVVIIHDVLSINTQAIKALHNMCDRINPLVGEAIYIITMQTKNYNSSQKKLAFVEKQIYYKLSKSIDEDILMPLVTRITDGAIVLVQPESQLNLRHCKMV